IEEGIAVEVLPGPSAVLAALVASGLPPARFAFEGFLSRKPGERRRRLEAIARDDRTLVFFEAPGRVVAALQAVLEAFGPRRSSETREVLASALLGEHLPRTDFGAAAQLPEAPGADHAAPELLQILRRAAEHAGILTLDQDDAVVLDGNIEVVTLSDSEGLPH